jgi:glycerate kinase
MNAPDRTPMTSTEPPTRPGSTLRVVIAPDSFKGSLDATAVAAAIADGWATTRSQDELVLLPQADGGEGTLDAVASCRRAERRALAGVRGPDGHPTTGQWLRLDDGTAVVELAQMNGLPMMAAPDPCGASTFGLGQVIAAALDDGARALLVGLGGSASTDGGAGALRALGAQLRDGRGADIALGGAALARLASIDLTHLHPPPPGGVQLLTDTTAVLCGPAGAAHVFGPQKGADPTMCAELDAALGHFAACLSKVAVCRPDQPGAGAAGGTGFGLAAWGATLVPGAARTAELTGLAAEFGCADVIVTGEGQFDRTSLTGKLVGSILHRCAGTSTRPVVIAGRFAATPPAASMSLTELAGSAEQALAHPARWAHAAGAAAAAAL